MIAVAGCSVYLACYLDDIVMSLVSDIITRVVATSQNRGFLDTRKYDNVKYMYQLGRSINTAVC